LRTFDTLGITTHGVWTEHGDDPHRLIALIEYPPGGDPEHLTQTVMTSAQFAADMAGFTAEDLLDVQTTLLDPTSFSPIN
jgi:hypothetical protein